MKGAASRSFLGWSVAFISLRSHAALQSFSRYTGTAKAASDSFTYVLKITFRARLGGGAPVAVAMP